MCSRIPYSKSLFLIHKKVFYFEKPTSALALVEDLEVHDPGESAHDQLAALGSGFGGPEDPHAGPVVPVQVALRGTHR